MFVAALATVVGIPLLTKVFRESNEVPKDLQMFVFIFFLSIFYESNGDHKAFCVLLVSSS